MTLYIQIYNPGMRDAKTRDTGVSLNYIKNNYIRNDGNTPVSIMIISLFSQYFMIKTLSDIKSLNIFVMLKYMFYKI